MENIHVELQPATLAHYRCSRGHEWAAGPLEDVFSFSMLGIGTGTDGVRFCTRCLGEFMAANFGVVSQKEVGPS